MPGFDRARCREAAAECVDLARIATDTNTKQILLDRAQEWLKLAYSDHDAEFTKLLGEFNTRNYVGWPSEEDPYASADPTQPAVAQILTKLKPAS